MPAGEIPLEAPPAEPRIAPVGLLARLLPLVMLLASVGSSSSSAWTTRRRGSSAA